MHNELKHFGIKGQQWGVRRYQNPDGTLTQAGKRRYAQEILDNKGKKKDNRIDTSSPNPRRWISEDMDARSKTIEGVQKGVNAVSDFEKKTRPKARKKARADLSNISDSDLQKIVNRERLERQYDELFNPAVAPTVSKGRQTVQNILEVSGAVLAIGASAVAIAKGINDLQKGKD